MDIYMFLNPVFIACVSVWKIILKNHKSETVWDPVIVMRYWTADIDWTVRAALSGAAGCHSVFKRVGETKWQRCETQHRIVQSVGRGDLLTGAYALLWSGFGSPWQHVCSHPALSKVSARTSRRAGHTWGCVPIFIVTTGPFLDRLCCI